MQPGTETMTKAKARQRAKAKSGQKAKKRLATTGQPDQHPRPGQFDPGTASIKSPGNSVNTRSFAEGKRGGGAARSR